jgi:hypothetical protein
MTIWNIPTLAPITQPGWAIAALVFIVLCLAFGLRAR